LKLVGFVLFANGRFRRQRRHPTSSSGRSALHHDGGRVRLRRSSTLGHTIGMQRLPVAQNTSPIHVLLVGSVSGDKVELPHRCREHRELR
jgi:hypothetical protein